MELNSFFYKGVLIGKGLLFEENSQNSQKYVFEATDELTKNRIPFFQHINNKLNNGLISDNDDNWRIVNNENQYIAQKIHRIENELITFEEFKIAPKEQFCFFYTKQNNPFSQFFKCKIEIDNQIFNCSEQYYAYNKALMFKNKELSDEILSLSEPVKQKKAGGRVKNFNQDKWLQDSRFIVYKSNLAKFRQNKRLKTILLETENSTIVEDSPRDLIWGNGISEGFSGYDDRTRWTGTNWLGEALIQVREELKLD